MIEKPPGLVVHAAPGHRGPTLVDLLGDLLAGGEDPQRPGIVHRLDKDTSGLMVVARGADAHRRLARLIKARQVRRSYLALVEGHPRSRTGTIDAPLGRDYRAPERRAVGGRAAARRSHSLQGARAAGRGRAGRGPPRDRAHPPGPRPLRGDRPSGGGRPALRAGGAARPGPPVPAQRRARVPAPVHGRGAEPFAPTCRRTWPRPWLGRGRRRRR